MLVSLRSSWVGFCFLNKQSLSLLLSHYCTPKYNLSDIASAKNHLEPPPSSSATQFFEPLVDPGDQHYQHFQLMSKICHYIYENNRLTTSNPVRQAALQDVKDIVRKLWDDHRIPHRFRLFGSSLNGFGLKNSDFDICLELKQKKSDKKALIKLRNKLVKDKRFHVLKSFYHARIPLIKFKHVQSQLEGDITLQNVIAIQNTLMLQAYSRIDRRCKELVFTMKFLSKSCKIADASKNFLSSYAYTLMVIYFLQQLENPVLPVLQSLHTSQSRPELIVKSQGHSGTPYNCWYYRHTTRKQLKDVWPCYGKNKQSTGELWIQLLKFYSEFNFDRHFVCIANSQVQEKPTLDETTRVKIRIQDPFEIHRNLGTTLSVANDETIRTAFKNAYNHFQKMPPDWLSGGSDVNEELIGYYFNADSILTSNSDKH